MESPAAVPTCPTACRKHFQISSFSHRQARLEPERLCVFAGP